MKTYTSKFGSTLMLFLTFLFGGILVFMIYQDEPLKAILSTGGILMLIYLFILHLNFSTLYTITDTGILIVKCSFLYHQRFDIHKIKSVAKTNTLMSSPAPSLDRLELTYGEYNTIVISPKDKIAFVSQLIKTNPNIENKIVV
ncbi:PH domain-containing protein [Formosa algae]|uniref:PH domain-containing protein n=1 Tax=Formosa algae TaxID=225843 RepID=UPI000CCED7B6|nr:PH domain-containing protein [Formosa algae]PNW28448.1 hypothetical protein BKP44_08695 [Formosa algae]